jgi:curved DNA-binding protein CbpA
MRHDRRPAYCYGILGLTSDATLAHVEKAHRKLARQHYPDR